MEPAVAVVVALPWLATLAQPPVAQPSLLALLAVLLLLVVPPPRLVVVLAALVVLRLVRLA